MIIRYRRSLSTLFFIALGVIAVLYWVEYTQTGKVKLDLLTIFSLAILTIITIMFRTRPYFEFRGHLLIIYGLLGIGTRRFAFQSTKDFKRVNDRLYLLDQGQQVRLPISKSLVSRSDWQEVLKYLG